MLLKGFLHKLQILMIKRDDFCKTCIGGFGIFVVIQGIDMNQSHALFHILQAYLRLFWCSIEHFRYRFRTSYKSNTKSEPEN